MVVVCQPFFRRTGGRPVGGTQNFFIFPPQNPQIPAYLATQRAQRAGIVRLRDMRPGQDMIVGLPRTGFRRGGRFAFLLKGLLVIMRHNWVPAFLINRGPQRGPQLQYPGIFPRK